MPPIGPTIVYSLCLATSMLCAVLLVRAYRESRSRLLLWSALCFVCLAVNNLLVVLDMLFLPTVDLSLARQLAAIAGLALLLYGFVWEARS
ncbi:MAG TPA: DUF5985 family protein [Caulobacteraceae bacterium]|nr:DUF5985 family protein [Caulobacteraceae bacterium]